MIDFMVGNFVLRRLVTSPNNNFKYSYPHSNALFFSFSPIKVYYFAPIASGFRSVNKISNNKKRQVIIKKMSSLHQFITGYTVANV